VEREEKLAQRLAKKQVQAKRQKVQDAEDEEEKQMFLNPLLAFKEEPKKKADGADGDNSSEWSDDDKYEPKMTREQKRAQREKDKKILGKRKKGGIAGDIDDVQDFFKDGDIPTVPVNDLEKKKKKGGDSDSDNLPSGYSSMDSEEIAETRALAKKMLRKKFREETVSASYSRYAFDDDDNAALPAWFLENEAKYNIPNVNLTQEEIDEEKRQLKEWNERPSKKVTEAKNRKKMRLVKAMVKLKSKAQIIATQDQSEGSKMRQIQKMYSKEKKKHVEEKSYVVNRAFNSSQGGKVGRNVKMVDKRLRSDTRNAKLKKKSKGGKGANGKPRRIKKTGKR